MGGGKIDSSKKADEGPDRPLKEMVILTMVKPCDRAKIFQMILGEESLERTHKGKTYYIANDSRGFRDNALYFMNDAHFPDRVAARCHQESSRTARPGEDARTAVARARSARIKHHFVFAVNMNEPSFKEVKPQILAEFTRPRFMEEPSWAFIPLLDVRSATLTVDVGKGIRAQGNFTFPDPEVAARGADALKDALFLARVYGLMRFIHEMHAEARNIPNPLDCLFFAHMARQGEASLREAVFEQHREKVEVLATCQFDLDAMRVQAQAELKILEKDQETRLAKTRRQSVDNLNQIVLALHSHHDTYKFLPPAAICSKKDGKPLLSWRVAILPFIGEEELFKQFKLDEAWDGPHNKKLMEKMPRIYASVDERDPFRRWPGKALDYDVRFGTYYQVFAGPGAAFETFVDKNSYLGATGTLIPKSFPDGLPFTLAVVEAPMLVPWTKPADLVYAKNQPLPAVGGGMFEGGFHAAFMDTSVRFLSINIDPGTLRALVTRDGGEVIDWDKVK